MNKSRKIKLFLDIAFIILISLLPISSKPFDKYFIELPKSFYMNFQQNSTELWHPRLILSQISNEIQSFSSEIKEKSEEKSNEKSGKSNENTKEKTEEKNAFLQEKGYLHSFLEVFSENPKVKSNKMSCSCKFIPEFSGSEAFIEKKPEDSDETSAYYL